MSLWTDDNHTLTMICLKICSENIIDILHASRHKLPPSVPLHAAINSIMTSPSQPQGNEDVTPQCPSHITMKQQMVRSFHILAAHRAPPVHHH